MNLNFRSTSNLINQNVRRFQQGGPMEAQDPNAMPPEGGEAPMPEESGAPEQGGGDQMQQIAGQLLDMLMQQVGDPQAVAAILQTALEMLQSGGGEPAPQEEPIYRAGGRLVRRISRN